MTPVIVARFSVTANSHDMPMIVLGHQGPGPMPPAPLLAALTQQLDPVSGGGLGTPMVPCIGMALTPQIRLSTVRNRTHVFLSPVKTGIYINRSLSGK